MFSRWDQWEMSSGTLYRVETTFPSWCICFALLLLGVNKRSHYRMCIYFPQAAYCVLCCCLCGYRHAVFTENTNWRRRTHVSSNLLSFKFIQGTSLNTGLSLPFPSLLAQRSAVPPSRPLSPNQPTEILSIAHPTEFLALHITLQLGLTFNRWCETCTVFCRGFQLSAH
jgi:hypothetical protein